MARSTKGIYKRGNIYWLMFKDGLGKMRFESGKTSNKAEAEEKLILRRREAMEGIALAPTIKPVGLDKLEEKYLVFVGSQRGIQTKRYHFGHLKRHLGNPPIHTLTVELLDRYREDRRRDGVGPGTINREIATLKHAMTKAVQWKLLRESIR